MEKLNRVNRLTDYITSGRYGEVNYTTAVVVARKVVHLENVNDELIIKHLQEV